jgi:hypothetical protein
MVNSGHLFGIVTKREDHLALYHVEWFTDDVDTQTFFWYETVKLFVDNYNTWEHNDGGVDGQGKS